jgi:DUF1365 family protein
MKSGIYQGTVSHQRFTPIKHYFNYKLFMLYLDLDEIDFVFNPYWLWSINKPNLASFYRKDYLNNPKIPLKAEIKQFVKEKSGYEVTGPIRLLTHLRFWFYCFNPISIYYIFDAADRYVEMMVLEVSNTPWGERHCYIVTPDMNQGTLTQQNFLLEKKLHVSPLLTMHYDYACNFIIKPDSLSVKMACLQGDEKHFAAFLNLQRQEINSRNLAAILWKFPFMTGKVIFLIYYQALIIWLKGAKFYTHPAKKKGGSAC